MARLALYVLGPLQLCCDGTPVTGLESAKVRALLVYLAVEAARPHPRAALAGLLWPELAEVVAQHNLRQALTNLRQVLGDRSADPPFLLISRETVQFNPASNSWLDAAAFTGLLAACETHPHRRAITCASCAERRARAAALYRGDFLAQFFLRDSRAFEEWASLKRERLRQQALEALGYLSAYYVQRRAYQEARRYAWQWLELDPWDEAAHQHLMRALWLSGQRSAALAHYERCCRTLRQELGVEPAPETTTLYEQIRDTELDAVARLDDTGRVPAPSTPFIGREAELAQLADLLQHPACRLITLTGPGGIGKTRLAVQAATDQRPTFADGVSFVALAALTTADLLAPTIATVLTLVLDGRADPTTQLLRYLRDKDLLLVLDNFEHLLSPESAGPDVAAGLVSEILRQAPRVTLLVTSRERLHLQGEWVVDVAGLPYPADTQREGIEGYSAVQLFLEGARRAQAGFALTVGEASWLARICRLVEGMPLGLELAAAWVRVLTCQEIARELERGLDVLAGSLRDVPMRHQSLRAVLAHSWGLLTVEEQRVLRQLAVFRGGVEREAAEQVAGASLTVLAALVDKSLLRRSMHPAGTCRFDLHELVRQYAEEQLEATREAETLRRRHAEYYLRLAEAAEPALRGPEQAIWLDRLEAEHDNLRAALAWAVAGGHAEVAARLAVALAWFWSERGYLSEGQRWLETVLGMRHALPGSIRAMALGRVAGLVAPQGDPERAQAPLQESLALWRELGNQEEIASTLFLLGDSVHLRDPVRATTLLEESLALSRELGDKGAIAFTLHILSGNALLQGDAVQALALEEASLALYRELGNKSQLPWGLKSLGHIALRQGDTARATTCFVESLALCREMESQRGLMYCLVGLAGVAGRQGQPERAARLLGAAEELAAAVYEPPRSGSRIHFERYMAVARAQLDDATWEVAWAEGRAMSLEHAIAYALDPTTTVP
ncbi:MAG: AAA family ATPase [Chloroflexota bacterium]|nr:AAA family ATPase [Chloroflexota bacterium]